MKNNYIKKIFSVFNEYIFINQYYVKQKTLVFLNKKFCLHKKIVTDNGNKVYIRKNNRLEELSIKDEIPGLILHIRGTNNIIVIDESVYFENCQFNIHAKDNKIEICEGCALANLKLDAMSYRCNIILREKVSCNEMTITLWNDDTTLDIGKDCQFSYGVEITLGDGHIVKDLNSGKILNINNRSLTIGEHNWIGKYAKILAKNTTIGNNNIIGAYAVVTKSFNENNVVIAGNPAKIVKKDIEWDRKGSYRNDR